MCVLPADGSHLSSAETMSCDGLTLSKARSHVVTRRGTSEACSQPLTGATGRHMRRAWSHASQHALPCCSCPPERDASALDLTRVQAALHGEHVEPIAWIVDHAAQQHGSTRAESGRAEPMKHGHASQHHAAQRLWTTAGGMADTMRARGRASASLRCCTTTAAPG